MKHQRYTIPPELSRAAQNRLVLEGDARFDEKMALLADRLTSNQDLHLIGLTGPSCSGKTTAAQKLKERFSRHGKRIHVISIDDFYYNKDYLLELTLRKGKKELDYDSEETIDTELLSRCVDRLLDGKGTALPSFNFHTGMREMGKTVIPERQDVFLFEGIQVLYPKVEKILSRAHCQTVYISPMTELAAGDELFSSNEIRLLRRIVRDYRFRSTSPDFTFRIWQSVRENEEAHIFPYLAHCHDWIDSTMPYELGVLKPYLEEILSTVSKDSPYAPLSAEILHRLRDVPIVSSEFLTKHSLYKEFI